MLGGAGPAIAAIEVDGALGRQQRGHSKDCSHSDIDSTPSEMDIKLQVLSGAGPAIAADSDIPWAAARSHIYCHALEQRV